INSARKSIYIEQAEFDDARLIQLLIQKSREGLEIKILLDQYQQVNQATLEELKAQNISVQYYPARKGQYERVKLLVVDQEQAVVYGSAWTETDIKAHTAAVKLSERAAWKAALVFSKDWEFTTTLSVTVPKTSLFPEDNITLATNANIKQQIIEQINDSASTIWIETAIVSETDTVQALIDAADKGRNVRLLLDPNEAKANPLTIEKLINHGIQIRYYSTDIAHRLNLGLFDNKTFILSSSSWTYYSFVINHELSLKVPSAEATKKLVDLFNLDWNAGN
ncbi:MAG TPA: phospholipase D-like domain-containing protein, partial [Desulfitobacteriaceae bacterium]|nr:phospholipase D-like domain-containing protein [Desulfitobacteriaceae bacterium]